jgi:hypothetical protein
MKSVLRRVSALLLTAVAVVCLTGCTLPFTAPVIPPHGWLFNNTKAPLTVEFNGHPAGPELKKVSKKNTLFFRDILFTGGTVAWDDVAIAQIAREGGIQEISYADYELLSILSIFGTFTINVYGN